MAGDWHVGNADVDGAGNRGWILGHFLPAQHDVRSSSAVEVKWGVHPAGEQRVEWVTGDPRTTMLLLIKGRFRISLSVGSFELVKQGDYAVWGPGIDHRWEADEDSVVLAVRWPSVPLR